MFLKGIIYIDIHIYYMKVLKKKGAKLNNNALGFESRKKLERHAWAGTA